MVDLNASDLLNFVLVQSFLHLLVAQVGELELHSTAFSCISPEPHQHSAI